MITPTFKKMLAKYQNEKLATFQMELPSDNQDSLLFLGDSIMDLFDISQLNLRLPYHNRGISGITSTFLLEHLPSVTMRLNPKSIVLLIGTNDLGEGEAPLSVFCQIAELCEQLKARFPHSQLYLLSLLPTNERNDFQEIVGERTNDRINHLNLFLQGLADVTYIDLHTHLSDQVGQLADAYTVDGLHLSKAGYRMMAETLKPYLT